MMNTEELIEECMDIVQDSTYGRDWFLKQLNRGLNSIAGRVLLPGLADGEAQVTTLTTDNVVALPATYHRNLYQCLEDGNTVRIYLSPAAMRDGGYLLNLGVGDVKAVTVANANLLYQRVPAVAAVLDLRFYRKPTVLTDSSASIPEGAGGFVEIEDFLEAALIAYVCNKLFARIEQGVEGGKPDTDYWAGQYSDALEIMGGKIAQTRRHWAPRVKTQEPAK